MAVKPKEFNITLKHVFIMHSSLGGPRYGVLDTYNAKAYYKKVSNLHNVPPRKKGRKKILAERQNKKI